jgi:hypothetical protein
MKYVVLKIAVGVFLGIVAALAVYKAFQIWEANSIAESYAKAQRLQSETLKVRTAAAANNLTFLFPEKLIGLCGPPLRDYFVRPSGYRNMEYAGRDGRRINVYFSCIHDHQYCMRFGMNRVDETVYDSGHPPDYETYMTKAGQHDDPASQILELPCLIGLAEFDKSEHSEYEKRTKAQ